MPTSSDIQNSLEAFRLKTRSINFDISILIPIRFKILPHVTLTILGRIFKSEYSANSCALRSACLCWLG